MSMSAAGAAALGAVGSAAASASGTMLGSLVSQRYNERMWNLNNEYNSPAAQMQRYSDAGLNPNLVYGQGSNGNATALHQDPLRFDFRPAQDSVAIANAVSNLAMQKAQINKINAETQNTELQSAIYARDALAARLEQSVMENEGAQLSQSPWFAGIQSKLLQNKLTLQKLNFLDKLNPITLATSGYDLDNAKYRSWQSKLNYEFSQQLNPLKLQHQNLENQLTARQMALLNARIGLLGAQTDTEQQKWWNMLDVREGQQKRNTLLHKQIEWFNSNQAKGWVMPILNLLKFVAK